MATDKEYTDLKSFIQECKKNKFDLEYVLHKANISPLINVVANKVLKDIDRLIEYIEKS